MRLRSIYIWKSTKINSRGMIDSNKLIILAVAIIAIVLASFLTKTIVFRTQQYEEITCTPDKEVISVGDYVTFNCIKDVKVEGKFSKAYKVRLRAPPDEVSPDAKILIRNPVVEEGTIDKSGDVGEGEEKEVEIDIPEGAIPDVYVEIEGKPEEVCTECGTCTYSYKCNCHYKDCTPPSCPSGYSDRGVSCSGDECKRKCVKVTYRYGCVKKTNPYCSYSVSCNLGSPRWCWKSCYEGSPVCDEWGTSSPSCPSGYERTDVDFVEEYCYPYGWECSSDPDASSCCDNYYHTYQYKARCEKKTYKTCSRPRVCDTCYDTEHPSPPDCRGAHCTAPCISSEFIYPKNVKVIGDEELQQSGEVTSLKGKILKYGGKKKIKIYGGSGGKGVRFHIYGKYYLKPIVTIKLNNATVMKSQEVETDQDVPITLTSEENTITVENQAGSFDASIQVSYYCYVQWLDSWSCETEETEEGVKYVCSRPLYSSCDLSDRDIHIDLTDAPGIENTLVTPVVKIGEIEKLASKGSWYTTSGLHYGEDTVTVEYILTKEESEMVETEEEEYVQPKTTYCDYSPRTIVVQGSPNAVKDTTIKIKNIYNETVVVKINVPSTLKDYIISVEPDSFDLRPGETKIVDIKVKLPEDKKKVKGVISILGCADVVRPVSITLQAIEGYEYLFVSRIFAIIVPFIVGSIMYAMGMNKYYILVSVIILGIVFYFVSPILVEVMFSG